MAASPCFTCVLLLATSGGLLLATWLQPTAVVVQLQAAGVRAAEPERGVPAQAAKPGKKPADVEAISEPDDDRYAYGVSAPMELPSPPPSSAAAPPAASEATCQSDAKYSHYLQMRGWEGQKARVGQRRTSYMCYQHRDVAQDATLGRSTCRDRKRCPVQEPTYPAPAEGCLCCRMAGHTCPPCWGCLLPLSRRRVFGKKLYEREIGGTAKVFLAEEVGLCDPPSPHRPQLCASPGGILARPRAPAAQTLDGVRTELIFKLRDGEVKDDEREVSPAAARTED